MLRSSTIRSPNSQNKFTKHEKKLLLLPTKYTMLVKLTVAMILGKTAENHYLLN